MNRRALSRRDFLRLASLGMGGLALRPWYRQLATGGQRISSRPVSARTAFLHRVQSAAQAFPQAERLGRALVDRIELKARPDEESPTVGFLDEDQIVVWLREVVGSRPLWHDQRYIETPDGYVYAPNVQPVWNQPNQPLQVLPGEGMWVEVTVPYVDLVLANPPGRSPWLKYTSEPRLYYSQIMWIDQIKTDEQGQIWYRVGEKYGSYGDFFWAPGEAFRPIAAEEIEPISPGVEDKLVIVNLTYQTMACFEGQTEVYFCRVSTGPKLTSSEKPGIKWATPPGKHSIWRKLVSLHMTGGTTGAGYDIPGIGWTTLFSGQGMAIHSTFWHNNYGVPRSHGCVNACPEDAKWVFRWTLPFVPFDPGDVVHSGQGSTKVLVVEE